MSTPAQAKTEQPDLTHRDLTDAEVVEAVKEVDEADFMSADETRRRLLRGIADRRKSEK